MGPVAGGKDSPTTAVPGPRALRAGSSGKCCMPLLTCSSSVGITVVITADHLSTPLVTPRSLLYVSTSACQVAALQKQYFTGFLSCFNPAATSVVVTVSGARAAVVVVVVVVPP